MLKARQQKGIALIEALIAAVILGVGLLGLAQLQTRMIASNTDSKQQLQATKLAQEKIEEFRTFVGLEVDETNSLDFDEITSCNNGNASNPCDIIISESSNYNRSWVVTDVQDASATTTYYKNIDVTVSWTSTTGTESVQVSTLIGRASPAASGGLLQ